MLLLVFVVLLGTVVTLNSAQPEVEMSIINSDNDMILTCRTRGFNTSDIVLNIKKNHCVLTKEDGVKTEGVKPQGETYWRRDYVIVPQSDKSNYSCEVVHAASRFHVEKFWDPDSDGGGRIISSKFIDTTPPDVFVFAKNYEVQTNIIVTCLVSGFYPNNITLNMKRNGRILTREDGVKSSGVCSYEDGTFQRRDYVEIKTSDTSDFSCEVIHDASGSHVEKVWDHHLPPPPHSGGAGDKTRDNTGAIVGAVVVLLLLLVLVVVLVVLKKKGILGAAKHRTINASDPPEVVVVAQPVGNGVNDLLLNAKPAPSDPPSGGNDVNKPLLDAPTESKTSPETDNSSDSGVNGSAGSGSGASTPSDSSAPDSSSPDSGNNDEAENS